MIIKKILMKIHFLFSLFAKQRGRKEEGEYVLIVNKFK
jgi:hypothetical protein